jgi:hypothetical protein
MHHPRTPLPQFTTMIGHVNQKSLTSYGTARFGSQVPTFLLKDVTSGYGNLPSSPVVDTSSSILKHIDNGTYAVGQAQSYIYKRGSRQHCYRRPLLNVSFSSYNVITHAHIHIHTRCHRPFNTFKFIALICELVQLR